MRHLFIILIALYLCSPQAWSLNTTNTTSPSPLASPDAKPSNASSPSPLPASNTTHSPSPAPAVNATSPSPSPAPTVSPSPAAVVTSTPQPSPDQSPLPNPGEPNECTVLTSCGDCLAEGCHWCAFPDVEGCQRPELKTCRLYRSPGQGCIGILQLNLSKVELGILFGSLILIGFGLIMLGHMIIKPIIFILAAAIGFLMGATVMYWIMSQTAKVMWPVWVFGAICALGAGFMSLRWLRIGICLIGALTGVLIAMLIFGAVEDIRKVEYSAGWAYGALGIGAVVGALLALLFERIILILGTSFLGAYAICRSILYFSGHEVAIEAALTGNLSEASKEGSAVLWLYLTGILMLTFAGIYYQCRKTQGKTYEKGKYRNRTEQYETVDGPPALRRAPSGQSGTVAAI